MPKDPKDWSYMEILAEKPMLIVQVDGREAQARIVRQGTHPNTVVIAFDLNGERERGRCIPWVHVLRHVNKGEAIYV